MFIKICSSYLVNNKFSTIKNIFIALKNELTYTTGKKLKNKNTHCISVKKLQKKVTHFYTSADHLLHIRNFI